MGCQAACESHLTEKARKVLDKLAGELLREGIHSHSEVRQGAVAEMLVDVARQYEAGLIVIGTKGMEGAGPVVVGAIAEQLVRLAPCPVLAVAADWNAGPNRPTPGGPVLLAMERNDAAAAAAATAYSLAETFNRPLLVLHVRTAAERAGKDPCAAKPEDFGVNLPPRPHHARSGGSGWLLNEAPVHCLVKDGDPGDAIAGSDCGVSSVHSGRRSETRERDAVGRMAPPLHCSSASRVPVLCVPPEAWRVRRRAEVAVRRTSVVGAPYRAGPILWHGEMGG